MNAVCPGSPETLEGVRTVFGLKQKVPGTFSPSFSLQTKGSWHLFSLDVETIVQRAREKFPAAPGTSGPGGRVAPRIISDNGPQFIAKDFKEFIRVTGMTHVRTSPYYPQSNGKLERWHGSLKAECIRRGYPVTLDEARRLVAAYVEHYNHVRLHSAIGYVSPAAKLAGREKAIFAARDQKLEAAREQRRLRRAAARGVA